MLPFPTRHNKTHDASLRGFGEAILQDDAGNLTEATTSNLFLIDEKGLFTNGQDSGVLPGVTQDTVIHLANDLGISVSVKKLHLDALLNAREAFLAGTESGITPIATVDMNPIGTGTRGPLTAKLQGAYLRAVTGGNSRYHDWLTYVAPR